MLIFIYTNIYIHTWIQTATCMMYFQYTKSIDLKRLWLIHRAALFHEITEYIRQHHPSVTYIQAWKNGWSWCGVKQWKINGNSSSRKVKAMGWDVMADGYSLKGPVHLPVVVVVVVGECVCGGGLMHWARGHEVSPLYLSPHLRVLLCFWLTASKEAEDTECETQRRHREKTYSGDNLRN